MADQVIPTEQHPLVWEDFEHIEQFETGEEYMRNTWLWHKHLRSRGMPHLGQNN